MVASAAVLQVDVELGELQLDVVDVVEEQDQDSYVVVSVEQQTDKTTSHPGPGGGRWRTNDHSWSM